MRAVSRYLTLVNLAYTFAALVTSPLQAHALGPAGRGELAAVTVVLGFVGQLGDLGLGGYCVRESARGTAVRKLVGSVGSQLFVLGMLYAAAAGPVAYLVAGGRVHVYVLVLAGLLISPLLVPSAVTTSIVWGQQRWRIYAFQRLALPVGTLIVYPLLYFLHRLTVTSAGVTVLALGVAGLVPGYAVLRGAGRPERDRKIAADARWYGRRVWLTSLANQTNARLDQLLMTRLVASSQLGLYAVATNFSMIQGAFTNAVSSALLPRVAGDDADVVARVFRVVLALTSLVSAGMFVVVPFALPGIFGAAFSGAVVMCQILIVASVPFGLVQVMTATLNAIGEPGVAARGELISIGITVPLLVAFVGRYGGEAAALVSLAAYTVTAFYLVIRGRRLLGLTWREFLVLRRSDLLVLTSLPIVGRLFRDR
jgi:O-antigen/teichoic acid export membrane protein